jgi:hypothetical protein
VWPGQLIWNQGCALASARRAAAADLADPATRPRAGSSSASEAATTGTTRINPAFFFGQSTQQGSAGLSPLAQTGDYRWEAVGSLELFACL